MRTRYLRMEPGRRENYSAAVLSVALATCVGLTAFYFVRLFLSREPIGLKGGEDTTAVLRGDG